jgi:CRP-like cAMP-binding protein
VTQAAHGSKVHSTGARPLLPSTRSAFLSLSRRFRVTRPSHSLSKPAFIAPERTIVASRRASSERPHEHVRRPAVQIRPEIQIRPKNRLLAALPDTDFQRLRPHLTTIPIRTKQVLQKNGERIAAVYFPNGGVVSITTVLLDGTMVEAATVGDEGMLGVEAFLNIHAVAPGETLIQVPDTSAEMLSVGEFRREIARGGAFRDLIGRYTEIVIAQMMQSTACNAMHPVQQRCARWLLTTHDRMHQQDFHLSHEFLAMMLGVQRPTVSTVAGSLQQAGFIRYTHGHVNVTDRAGLEGAACECYAIIRTRFDRMRL